MAELLRSGLLAGIPHAFSTRTGLDASAVLSGGVLVTVRQVHSPRVSVVTKPFDVLPEADALVTDRPGLVLGVVTADCGPVLLAEPERGVIAAAHAGWRGAHGGILETTVEAMVRLGAQRDKIRAAIGPTIALGSYEVDQRFFAQFAADEGAFFLPGAPGRWQFDLPGYIAWRLKACGIMAIDDLALDTYADDSRFFSYRRATHRGGPTGGRQTSAIALPDKRRGGG